MRKNQILILLAFAFTLSFWGCTKEKITPEAEILVTAQEVDGEINLLAETVEEYPCHNYSIEFSLDQEGNSISVEFTEIVKPDICATAYGPATATIELGDLEEDTYTLEFEYKGEVVTGELKVKSSKLILDLEEGKIVQKG